MADFSGVSSGSRGDRDRPPPPPSALPASSTLSARVSRALEVHDLVSKHPVVESASILRRGDDSFVVKARLSTTSYKTRSKTYYTQSYFVSEHDGKHNVVDSTMEPVSELVKMSAEHSAGKWTAVFKVVEVKGKKRRIVEVRDSHRDVYHELDVTDTHADFLTGNHWGEPTWLDDERIVVYVAEHHASNWKDDDEPYTSYAYVPNCGEQLSAQTRPGLFLLDFSSEEAQVRPVDARIDEKTGDGTIFRQPTIAPRARQEDPFTIYATGCSLLPDGRRLGGIYCWNRPDAIYEIALPVGEDQSSVKTTRISSLKRSARYASVVKAAGGLNLVYFSNRRGHEHGSCATLHKRKLPISPHDTGESDILVDEVRAPSSAGGFPGLYPSGSALRCSSGRSSSKDSGSSTFLAVETAWASRTTIALVDLEDGRVHDQGSNEITSYRLLGTDKESKLLAIRSSPVSPPELVLGTVSESSGPCISWATLKTWSYRFQPEKHYLDTLYSCIVALPDQPAAEAIVVSGFPLDTVAGFPSQVHKQPLPGCEASGRLQSTSPDPLIIYPHGGPNSQFSTLWNFGNCLAWITAGYTVAIINYPGSTGFGQDTIEELSRDCGNLEVRACMDLKKYLIKLGVASDDKGKRLYLGGSHSGFIGAHLSVRWPDAFDAMDLRNPVVDLPSMFATSDIPDWTLSQLNLKYDFDSPPSFVPEDLHKHLRGHSPSSYAEKLFASNEKPCVTPTQLQLGANDLRVPSNQGKAWYHLLKGHGEQVNMLFFADNGHPLEQIWTQRKSLTAQLEFLVKHSRFD